MINAKIRFMFFLSAPFFREVNVGSFVSSLRQRAPASDISTNKTMLLYQMRVREGAKPQKVNNPATIAICGRKANIPRKTGGMSGAGSFFR
jgi:hypothetical protein